MSFAQNVRRVVVTIGLMAVIAGALWMAYRALPETSLAPVSTRPNPSTHAFRLKVGDRAPEMLFSDLDGQPVQLAELHQTRPLVLEFGSFT